LDYDSDVTWRYVDGFAVGTSHVGTETPCQDRCVCTVIPSADGGEVFVTVVSDGAGSATHSEYGAQAVCDVLVELVGERVRGCSDLDEIPDELVRSWLLEVRERLRAVAREMDIELREYAATALLAVASDRQAVCAQIGDGGIVFRRAPGDPFELALWPASGEYANQTYFVTDDAAAERIEIRRYDYIHDLIAFSDGLQNLALLQATRSPFEPFFEPLVRTVRGNGGANGNVRDELIAYLNSPAINQRTDDDKSLAIGCRMVAEE
jgi:hypothetical protein